MPFDKTSVRTDMYWSLNRTEIKMKPQYNNEIELYFDTVTPCFDHFEYSINGKQQRISKTPFVKWELDLGMNTLSVVSVNQFGVKGVISHIELNKQANQ